MQRGVFWLAVLGLAANVLAACSSRPLAASSWRADAVHPCEGIDPTLCLLPFPNDYDTVRDPSSPTGLEVKIPAAAEPRPTSGPPLDISGWATFEGFSPGSVLLAYLPGVDLASSNAPTIDNIGRSLARGSPVVLLDATSGTRWPVWAELDAADPNAATRLVMIHPARNLAEGHRYVVLLRNLRDHAGRLIHPPAGFARLLAANGGRAHERALHAHLQSLLTTLRHDRVSTNGVQLVWDFTVAPASNLTGDAVSMRNQAFASLGAAAPAFSVSKVVDFAPSQNPDVAREVIGTFDVPSFLSEPGGPPGSVLHRGPGGLPTPLPGNIQHANFVCEIPRAADPDPTNPAAPVHPAQVGIYGHGLFSDASEVLSSGVPQFSNTYDDAFCSTDWIGLAKGDIGEAAQVIADLNRFPTIPSRLDQALLDAQFLVALMTNPKGFASSPAFEAAAPGHPPLIDTSSTPVYYGNSEGGIMGGAFMALSTHVRRGVLGVPGMDYALLLPRSSDFVVFEQALTRYYPDVAEQKVIFDLLGLLWDRAEADGFAQQMTTHPLPGTPPHTVLLEEALGDHQVANIATETEARTIGAAIHEPALAPGRHEESLFGIPPITRSPWNGSALFIWDSGVPLAPPVDEPPPSSTPDPHDTVPRLDPAFWRQMDAFFATGEVIDPCGGPCR